MEESAFVASLLPTVWAGLVCLRARSGDPVRAGAWSWCVAAAVVTVLVAAFAAVAGSSGAMFRVSLYCGGAASLALFVAIASLARASRPRLRTGALLDGVIASWVVLVLATWAVVIPGVRDGDPVLTGIFLVDLVGFIVAACVAVASPSALDRRIGRWVAFAGLAAAVADGLVAARWTGTLAAPTWAVGLCWGAAAMAVGRAAQVACAGPSAVPADPAPTPRWVAGRVLLPLAAVLAIPAAAPLLGPPQPWEVALFGGSFVLVVALAFVRQSLLLLEHSRGERRERELRQEVQVRHDERLEQSIRDPLTGTYNRRFLFDALEKEVHRARRYGTECALVLFDVDDFKLINDTHGHAVGDDVLRRLPELLEPLLRPSDSFARIGGEEFAVLLPETTQLDALMVADRLRTAVARARILEGRRVTLSGGIGCCPGDARTREELLRRTDAALYWAKRNGKDLCALTSDAIAEELAVTSGEGATRGAHLYGLVASIDGQSRYTRDHSENVAAYASALGQALGLERERMLVLRRAALLHDIGKVAVPVGILSKVERLTDADFEEIKRHSWVGSTMLLRAGLEVEARFVRHHHERFDGRGYPDGIAGEEIPLESRILFVCDSFEAMTSDRAYRSGMPVADAIAELERCAGTQFDPAAVAAFRGLVERDELPIAALRAAAAPAPAA